MNDIKVNKEKLKNYLKELVSIPSYKDCKNIQNYISDKLSFLRWEKQFIGKNDLYNLISINPRKPFLINTHVDTVPPIDMENPFELKEKNGAFYGRGTADTKGLIASLILAIELFKKNFPKKELPVSLAFTVDEEQNTALGSEKLREVLKPIKYALILEPTYEKICNKQMGTVEFRLDLQVPSAHAAEFEKYTNPSKELCRILNQLEDTLQRDINIIKFHSGWEYYAIPKEAQILGEFKIYEGEKAKTLEQKLIETIAKHKNLQCTIEDSEDFLYFGEGFLVDTLKKAYSKALNKEAKLGTMPSWTDAANICKENVECVIFGTSHLDIAHTDREHITVKQMEDMTKVLYSLFSILSHLT
ncbi:MAG: M20 family metallopeptidase [Aquificae bacterium]|nr:M20 family metallopeptidase [Aquificota bacterium]